MNEEKFQIIYKKLIKLYDNDEIKWIKCQIYEDFALDDNINIDDYINNIVMKKKLGWNHKKFKEYYKKEQEQDDYISNPFEVEEGVIQCQKCNSFRVFSLAIQTRAADEPTTTFAVCSQCKNKWTQNN